MKCLLDTHFVIWVVSESTRLNAYPWLYKYQPWTISPISLLEIQLLAEVGRRRIDTPRFVEQVASDPRFQLDDAPFTTLVQRSLALSWTRDPFDRLIAAHSLVRRLPLCSVDQVMLEQHKLLAPELR